MKEHRWHINWDWEYVEATIIGIVCSAALICICLVIDHYFPHFFDLYREMFDHCKSMPWCCPSDELGWVCI